MKRLLWGLLGLLFLPSCLSKQKLAERCLTEFPCPETLPATTVITTKSDTFWHPVEINSLPIANITCFETKLDGSIMVIQTIPVPQITETITTTTTKWFEDSAKLYLKDIQLRELREENRIISMSVISLEQEVQKINAKKKNLWAYTIALLTVLLLMLLSNLLIYYYKKKNKNAN